MTRLSLVVALASLLCAALPARAQDAFSDHYEAATRFMEADQYEQALAELEQAYHLRQLPRVLHDMGKLQRKLGNAKEALALYQRYLTAEDNPDPAVKVEVEREIIQLKHTLGLDAAPPAALAPLRQPLDPNLRLVPMHYEKHHNRGLIGGGIAVLASGYAAALITGSIFAATGNNSFNGSSDSNGNLAAAGGTLIIPVVGPFVSALVYRSTVWSLPWTLFDGTAQVAGLAMIIAGARKTHNVPVYGDKFRLAPYATATGGGLFATGKF